MKIQLIGKKAKIDSASNKNLVGIEGIIIDETKNMIMLKTKNKENKRIIKKQIVLNLQGKKIKGKQLIGLPEERLKR